ncbi:MAG TPA: hypothetical protein VMY99_00365 [Nevskiaceae bacterium]|nr:hypothetical protein [Nevskiaceae bacterium]
MHTAVESRPHTAINQPYHDPELVAASHLVAHHIRLREERLGTLHRQRPPVDEPHYKI